MTKMLTLFGEDIGKLKYDDLKRERAMQAYMLAKCKVQLQKEQYYREQRVNDTLRGRDKIAFLEIYIDHLKAFVEEIDYWLERREENIGTYNKKRRRKDQIREANNIRHKRLMAEDVRALRLSRAIEKDSLSITWNRERFDMIVADRGYQTESALIADVAKELMLDRTSAKLLLDKGRFTWGQVLCLGAMLDMTPKEFCDTFLADYFVETHGKYRAALDNMDRYTLLKNPIRPATARIEEKIETEIEAEEEIETEEEAEMFEVVEVGADGRPLDEEIWFDE